MSLCNMKILLKALVLIMLLLFVPISASQRLDPSPAHFFTTRFRNFKHIRNGPAAKHAAFRKFGIPHRGRAPEGFPVVHKASTSATLQTLDKRKTQFGMVEAVPEQYHSEYLSPVLLGSEKQLLHIDFDTGSSDFWVFSTRLNASAREGRRAFNSSHSKTFKLLRNSTWHVRYGDGTGASGIVGLDKVIVGGASITKQAIEVATAVSQSFVDDVNLDGLMGLGFSNLNQVRPTPQKTFVDNLLPTLKEPVFCVDFREDGQGTLTFGRVPKPRYSGALHKVSVTTASGLWEFASPTYGVNGSTFQRKEDASRAIADTGTSLLIVDEEVANAYYSAVENAAWSVYLQGFVFPCTVTLPSFQIKLGGSVGDENERGSGRMAMDMLDVAARLLYYASIDGYWCYGGIQSNDGFPLQVFGDIMFRSGFFVFNRTRGQENLGWAEKA